MTMNSRLERFDHLVVLMLENRSFDSLCGYLYEHDEPRRFVPDEDREFRGVAGLDLANADGGNPSRSYPVQKAPYEKMADMYAPYPNAGEFYVPNINKQLYGEDQVSGDLADLPSPAPMQGFVEDYIRAIADAKTWDGELEATPDVVQQIMNCSSA